VAHYRSLGYDIAGVSDYQQIDHRRDGDSTFVPAYEHGYNVRKTHFLAIGARRVAWLDFPLLQSRSEKQYVIDRVADGAALVAMAHPALRGAETRDDLRYLSHYDLIEVRNHFVTSDSLWDAALSSGHPVWALGSDDSHNIDDPGQTGASRAADVIAALKTGRAYAVAGRAGASDAHPERVDVHGDTLTVACDMVVARIDFIGQDGHLVQQSFNVRSASYALRANDPYVRTVITTARTVMYLNPVVRYDGRALRAPVAAFDVTRTWSLRLGVLCTMMLLVWLSVLRAPAPRAALGAAIPSPVQ
jgi:hypothetical protein